MGKCIGRKKSGIAPLTAMNNKSQLSLIRFIGNPFSPHVRSWVEFLEKAGIECEVWHVDTGGKEPLVTCRVRNIFGFAAPVFSRLGLLRYFIGGILARFLFRDNVLCHAHCASGYGTVAWLSGRDYIMTTYGSEIYQASDRAALYRVLIKRILLKATLITATSQSMADALVNIFNIQTGKIEIMKLAVSEKIFYFDPEKRSAARGRRLIGSSELVWCVNRRVRPLYNTLEVVGGFISFLEAGGKGRLLVLAGDADATYLERVKRLASSSHMGGKIEFREGLLAQTEIAELLNMSDFAISVPNSDQMSSSIIEAMACRCLVVLSDLAAYAEVKRRRLAHFCQDLSTKGFKNMFLETAMMMPSEKETIVERAFISVKEDYSEAASIRQVHELYNKAIERNS